MNCSHCGHELNAYGICPVCGRQEQPQQQMYSQQQAYYDQQQVYNQQQAYYQQQAYNQQQTYNQQQAYSQPQAYGQPQAYYQQQQTYYNQQQQAYYNQQPPSWGQPTKKKKWPIFAGIGAAVVLLGLGTFLILHNRPVKDLTDDTDTTEFVSDTTESVTTEASTEHINVTSGSKTVMIYMVGSDLESEHDAASTDIDEILSSGYDAGAMHVLLYTGGCKRWSNSQIPEDENATFLLDNGELKELTSKPASNMGDPENLSEFLNYAYENYPAEQYDLILWNHGGGAFFGYGYDENTEDSLTLDELADAFSNSPFHDGNKLGFIGFDACLMGNIETAHMLSPYAEYMIASQESEPGSGWYYDFLNQIDSTQDIKTIGTAIVDSYMAETTDYMNSIPFAYAPICLSVMDLSQTAAVETALNDLFAKVDSDFGQDTYSKYSSFRKNSKELAASFSYTEGSYDVVDLLDYTRHLQTSFKPEALALENALSSFIVYSDSNEKNINGVSIYHPYYTKTYASQLIPIYKTFDFAENYTSYIAKFAGMLTDTDSFDVVWDPDSLVPSMNADSSFSVSLDASQAAALQNAYFVIAKKQPEESDMYDMVALSSAVSSDGAGTLTADFDGQITYMQNDTTKELYEMMYTVQEKTDTYTRYLLSSILYNDDIEGDDAVYAYFVLEVSDAHPEGQLLGAYPIDHYISTEGNEIFPERYELNVNDYKHVAFGYFSHKFTSTEDLTNFNEADWADLMIHYNSFPVTEGFTPVKDALLDGEEYYGMFIFEDTQGNRHCSSLVQIQ